MSCPLEITPDFGRTGWSTNGIRLGVRGRGVSQAVLGVMAWRPQRADIEAGGLEHASSAWELSGRRRGGSIKVPS